MSDEEEIHRSLRGPVESRPALQIPGEDEVLNRSRFPSTDGDRRLYLDVTILEKFLAIARSSPTHRVVLHNVRIDVSQRRSRNGHVYEVWGFEGGPAVPELSQAEATAIARRTS